MAYKKVLRPDSYAEHTLRRYSGAEPGDLRRYVLLTNFKDYVERFSALGECTRHTKAWDVVHNAALDCSLINFGIGSPLAAMTMHCLGFLDHVDAVIMLGLAGGLAESMKVGDFVLPTASIRDEGTSVHYLHGDVPALPNFKVQHVIQATAQELGIKTRSGIFKTTDYRMWEFDAEFARLLETQRVVAIDMEISCLFSVGYALGKPIGAVMLISDLPLLRSGIKSSGSTKEVLAEHCSRHLELGVRSIQKLREQGVFQAGEVLPYEW
jgi:AMP nucleosidase